MIDAIVHAMRLPSAPRRVITSTVFYGLPFGIVIIKVPVLWAMAIIIVGGSLARAVAYTRAASHFTHTAWWTYLVLAILAGVALVNILPEGSVAQSIAIGASSLFCAINVLRLLIGLTSNPRKPRSTPRA